MKHREFAGALNRCVEVLVPVEFSDHEEGVIWLPVKKSEARAILEHAREHGIEEIHAELDKEDKCLYVEVRSETETEEAEEEEAEEEEEEEETSEEEATT
jgi:hypothetical protein